MKRDSFVFYRSFYEAVKELPKEERLEVMDAMIEYAINGKKPELKGVSSAIFTLMKPQIDSNNKRFKNGKNGGRPKTYKEKPKRNQKRTETEPNVNVNVNENVNVNGRTKTGSNLWFEGEVIKLNESDYNSWLRIYGGGDNHFTDWLTNRDGWYAEQAPEIKKNWFIATSKQLQKIAA